MEWRPFALETLALPKATPAETETAEKPVTLSPSETSRSGAWASGVRKPRHPKLGMCPPSFLRALNREYSIHYQNPE